MTRDPRNSRVDDGAEPRLTEALGSLFDGAEPPASIAAELSRAARESARPEPGPAARPAWRVVAGVAGLMAAAALLAIAGSSFIREPESRSDGVVATDEAFDLADLDRSGRVDVWDAYLVAQAVEDGSNPLDPGLDLDGDGAVTRADADLVAQRAVEVPR